MIFKLRQSLGFLIAGLLLFFLIKPFVLNQTYMKELSFEMQWRWQLPSFCLLLVYRSLYPYPFAKLLGGITQKQVPFRTAFTLFHLANIMRYIPGRIWGVVRMLALSKQFGLSKTAVGTSLTLHVSIETALGGIIAMSVLWQRQFRDAAQVVLKKVSGHTVLFALTCVGMMAGILFLILTVSSPANQFLKTVRRTGVVLFQKSSWKHWLKILGNHVLLWNCQGLAFYLFVRSLTPVPVSDIPLLTACYAFAWIIGFLSFLTPGGLGVRDGLLGFLLANYMPTPKATLVALLSRLWLLLAEIILASVALLLA